MKMERELSNVSEKDLEDKPWLCPSIQSLEDSHILKQMDLCVCKLVLLAR
jgi:ferredoxin-thioredoxin reductase catalytic subunit